MPRIEQDPRARQAARRQQLQDGPDRQSFERHHGRLHGDRGLRYPGDQIKDDLRRRRIDGGSVVGTPDVGIDIRIAQLRQRVGCRQMQVGIDAGALHATVPDVAENIGRDRSARQQHQPHGKCDDQDGGEGAAVVGAVRRSFQDEPDRNCIGHRLQQRQHAGIDVIEGGDPQRAGGRKQQQAEPEPKQRPIEPAPALHSAALPAAM